MNIPNEIYEIIDFMQAMKHPNETKRAFFSLVEENSKIITENNPDKITTKGAYHDEHKKHTAF